MNLGNGLSLEIGRYQKRLETRLKQMQDKKFVQRLWNKDEDLFIRDKRISSEVLMGWLDLPDKMLQALTEINDFCKSIRLAGFDHVVLLGMGGSSLAPIVFKETFGETASGLKLTVLDTTEPETIKKIEREINISTTLFIVSSKSGTTAEVMAFYEYFYYRVFSIKRENAGENFIAITDKNSPLAILAEKKKFRKTFINFSDIGGRYSALSYFGIVPAALMGINVKEILWRAKLMSMSCGSLVPAGENSAVVLGAAMAEMASKGCEKLTYLLPEELDSFGLWLEQLIAESTGKEGKGILPFNGYPLGKKASYGKDRFFVKYGFCGEQNDLQSVQPSDLIAVNYPFINILIKDELDLGKEFFRWEIATATAGALLEINPFDQPNVQESKQYTDRLLKQVEAEGKLPKTEPALTEDGLVYYADGKKENGKLLLEDLLSTAKPGSYIAFQAYLPAEPEVQMYLSEMQKTLQANLKVAVCTQFGPRYLHSTGQYHKGGPDNGFFIQFVCSSKVDIDIPGHSYTFGVLKCAQATGDREALLKHKRRVIMVDLGEDVVSGLNAFKKVVDTLQPQAGKVKKAAYSYKKAKRELTHVQKGNIAVPQHLMMIQHQVNSGNATGSASAKA